MGTPPRRCIDLNADVGEAEDELGRQRELDLLGVVTTVHVACGGHAGDAATMRRVTLAAGSAGVAVGAHPSYPDRQGFGRRATVLSTAELSASLASQIDDLIAAAARDDVAVVSVKPHGALYGEVAKGGPACAALIEAMVATCAPGTAVVLPPNSVAHDVVRGAGFRVVAEGFCDRSYCADGSLMARALAGSVYRDPRAAAAQALLLALDGTVATSDGTMLECAVDTLCIHGDSPGAMAMAVAVRQALGDAGLVVAASAQS